MLKNICSAPTILPTIALTVCLVLLGCPMEGGPSDNIAPSFVGIAPSGTSVALSTSEIVIRVSENIRLREGATGNIRLVPATGTAQEFAVNNTAQVSIMNNAITLRGVTGLVASTLYTVSIPANLFVDASGNANIAHPPSSRVGNILHFTTASE